MPPKCCGTCAKWEQYRDQRVGACTHDLGPIPDSLRGPIILNAMYGYTGTNCPCWKPKEDEDASA